jgi:hypothetical protein
MVGNAATILQRQNGALIDSHDLVIRLNRAHVEGIEDKFGVWRLLLTLKARRLKPLLRRLPPLIDYLRSTRPNAVLAAEPRCYTMSAWALRLSCLDSRVVLSEHVQASHAHAVRSLLTGACAAGAGWMA